MTTLTIQIPDKDTEIVKQVLKKFNVKIVESDESPYDPKFVSEVQKGVEERKNGKKGSKVDVGKLWL